MNEKILIAGKAYRKFIPYPRKVTDGTRRCIRCGQIDEPDYHDHDTCVAVASGDYKGAKLKLKLRADSGFSSDVEAMVSVNQWRKISAILEGRLPTTPTNEEPSDG